jgi:hypothetical protein
MWPRAVNRFFGRVECKIRTAFGTASVKEEGVIDRIRISANVSL